MQLTDYIGFMIAIVGGIFALLVALWGTYEKKANRKRIRIRIIILIAAWILIWIIIAILYAWAQEPRQLTKEDIYQAIVFDMENENYLEAARTIDSLQQKHSADQPELNFYKGVTYLLYGFNPEHLDYIEKAIPYLKQAEQSKDTEIIYQSYLFLVLAYTEEQTDLYASDLLRIVNILENSDRNERSDLLKLKYLILGIYYENEFFKDFDEKAMENAAMYYEKSSAISIPPENSIEDYVFNLAEERTAYFYLKCGAHEIPFNTQKAQAYLTKSRDMIMQLLAQTDSNTNSALYLQYLKIQAKSECLLGMLTGDTATVLHGNELFQEIIYVEDSSLDYLVLNVGPTYTGTGLYTEDDWQKLNEKYNRFLRSIQNTNDLETVANIKYDLMICNYYNAKYLEDEKYQEQGLEYLNELDNVYYRYLNTAKRENLKLFRDAFGKLSQNN